jgi:GT2 family glycosyltransferase
MTQPSAPDRSGLADPRDAVGVVVIGRNEGERLRRCLESVAGHVVYVDSGSIDGSVAMARGMGVSVVELDLSMPFSAARARNAGFERLEQLVPDIGYVHFIDGDVELAPGWIATALRFLEEHPDVVAVAGRLHERYPDATIYQRLCDLEWDKGEGEIKACGGIALYRAGPFREAGGFNPRFVAGEEPELCVRLRERGGRIWSLADSMGWHDAQMSRFSQWWKRSVRCGHAYAQGAAVHGRGPARHNVAPVRSTLFWGLALPLAILALVLLGAAGWHLAWAGAGLGLALYAWLTWRIYRYMRRRVARNHAALYAVFCVLAKFPQMVGLARYWRRALTGRTPTLIEYKTAAPR